MTERPILFSAPMVRAILSGQKTQTRRVIKPQPLPSTTGWYPPNDWMKRSAKHYASEEHMRKGLATDFSPHGQSGDRLWVKEAWKVASFMEGEPVEFQYRADNAVSEENSHGDCLAYQDWYERICISSSNQLIKMDWPYKDADGNFRWEYGNSPLHWRPSIFMPRWASRITLEIVDVRVERLHEIWTKTKDFSQFISEGIPQSINWNGKGEMPTPLSLFVDLWNSINTKRGFGWNVNPWVWVIEFKRVTS